MRLRHFGMRKCEKQSEKSGSSICTNRKLNIKAVLSFMMVELLFLLHLLTAKSGENPEQLHYISKKEDFYEQETGS